MNAPGSAGQFERAEPSPQAAMTVLASYLGQIHAQLVTIEAKVDRLDTALAEVRADLSSRLEES